MSNDSSSSPSNGTPAATDLPPVKPPSGRFIAQLFLIPGLIVTVLVAIWLLGNYLVAERRDPDYFLRNLDSDNADIRWRAAHDLAQVLKRPESLELASDPVFALDLAERLDRAWRDLLLEEKQTAERIEKLDEESEKKAQWRKLRSRRDYVSFLIATAGSFTIPVGAPVLCRIVEEKPGPDRKAWMLRRRAAIWALANLGANVKRLEELPAAKKRTVLARLAEEGGKSGLRAQWAAKAHRYVTKKESIGVEVCLCRCADDDDPFVRMLIAHALNFWTGDEQLIEATLLRLAADDGRGESLRIEEGDQ